MQLDLLLWLIPVPPVVAFFVIWLFTNRSRGLSHAVAIVSILTSWALSLIVFFNVIGLKDFGKTVIGSSVPWLPTGESVFRMGVLADPLTAVMLFFVPLCCTMIFV
ncbi:MAG: hypothetical protein AABZ78_20065, partial [Chloroflexota bacterium]